MATSLLLVDDDARILETAQDILEGAGFLVRTAETGEAALKTLRDSPCDVMIVDFNLIDTTGVDLAVQARVVRPGLHILLMTGESNVELGPAKDIIRTTLTKPVDPSKLIDLIHKIS